MTERRYTQDEVEAIFQRAAEAQQAVPLLRNPDDGMTLGQLQEIGREVGITPDQIRYAASAIERTGHTTKRSLLGLPIGVGRAVDLDRKLTDSEWERLVVELRDTFDAKGRLRQEGNFKQWSNGNLHVMLEPMGDRHRLRMRTFRAQARAYIAFGAATMALSFAMYLSTAAGGRVWDPGKLWTLVLMGGAMFGVGAAMIPAWARERQRQMREIAERVATWASGPSRDTSR
jgi:hypothetical protein